MWLKVVILNVVNLVVQVFHNLLLIYNTISWVDRTAPKNRKYPERSSCVQKNVSSTRVRGQTGLTAWTTAATKITTGDNRDVQNIVNFRLFCRYAQQNGFLLIDSFSRLRQK